MEVPSNEQAAELRRRGLAEELAAELVEARRSGRPVEAPSRRYPGFSVDDGYLVARILHERRLASGSATAGAKLGFTNEALWELLGIDAPFWAPVYDDTVTGDRCVSLGGLVAPRIEPEIVLGLGRDVGPGASAGDLRAAVAWAALGFEVVQCRYPDWVLGAPDAIADAGLHGLLVVGERVAVSEAQVESLADTEVVLRRDGAEVARGRGTDALGGPLAALGWLVRLPAAGTVRAGELVTTGTLTAPAPVAPGETWRSEATGPVALGALEVVLEESGTAGAHAPSP